MRYGAVNGDGGRFGVECGWYTVFKIAFVLLT
jgi:hypothetical protein